MNNKKNNSYHNNYERWTRLFSYIYKKIYNRIYQRSLELARIINKDILLKNNPRVLLCGTACSETTKNFIRFIKNKNTNTIFTVLDINPQPLEMSKKILEQNRLAKNVSFILTDARCTNIRNNSIDLIETDLFLQFFSKEDKQKVINEWSRILSEDGVIITREFIPKTKFHRWINILRMRIAIKKCLQRYETDSLELKELFHKAGLKVNFHPFKYGSFHSRLLQHIVAYRNKF